MIQTEIKSKSITRASIVVENSRPYDCADGIGAGAYDGSGEFVVIAHGYRIRRANTEFLGQH